MLNLTCTMISSVDIPCYGVSRAKNWVSKDCGTTYLILFFKSVLKMFLFRTMLVDNESEIL